MTTAPAPTLAPTEGSDFPMPHVSFRAMGCQFTIWLSVERASAMARLTIAEAWVHTMEAALTRFRPTSELMQLNARAGRPVRVSPLLWAVLGEALRAARSTQGRFDPTVLPALRRAGYDRTFEAVRVGAGPGSGETTAQRCCWRDIALDETSRTVTLPSGVEVDLGGIAKGWAADHVAANLADLGPVLVDAGGDICARGSPPGQGGWTIGVQDPLSPERDLAVMEVRDRGVATSGTDYRRWVRDGVQYHHIIDPSRGTSADTDVLAATVIAPTATEADVLAKVAVLLGAARGLAYVEALPQAEALIVDRAGTAHVTSGFQAYAEGQVQP